MKRNHRIVPSSDPSNRPPSVFAAANLRFCACDITLDDSLRRGEPIKMLLTRDYVGHMAKEVVKRLLAGEMIETKGADAVTTRVRQTMMDEMSVEDRLNDDVREILNKHSDEMRRTGASYQEMFKKVKVQLAKERKLVLR